MWTKNLFRKHDPVEGLTFDGLKIIGNYIRVAPSFGAIIIGIPEGKVEQPKEYRVQRFSLVSRKPPKKAERSTRISLIPGDPCTGETPDGKLIIGKYCNAGPKPFAYIRGVISKDGLASPFDALETFKVLRSSLKKQA